MDLANDQTHRKRAWTKEEDKKLIEYIKIRGECNWNLVSKVMGLDRDGKSCRERWTNYLNPDIKRGPFSKEEEEMITQLHAKLGNQWTEITKTTGRSSNDIKNFCNGKLKRERKKVLELDVDGQENQAKLQLNSSGESQFSSMVSASYPLDNPHRSSPIGLLNTQENQLVPTFMSQHLEHFESNNKYPFLNNCLSDSVPVLPMLQFGRSNYRINSYSNVEPCLIHSLPSFTSAPQTVSSSGWCMIGGGTITSTDTMVKDINVHGKNIMNIQIDELLSLLDSSPSSAPLPEWDDLCY